LNFGLSTDFSFSFGSAKKLSESLSQKVKSPIVYYSQQQKQRHLM